MSKSALQPPRFQVLERGWLSANNIVLIGPDDAALVDSGYCTHSAQTVALVEAALGGRTLNRLLNTHLHSDHCGGNAALQAHFPHLRTLIPPGEAAAVANWDMDVLSYRATGQQCPRFSFDDVIAPGTEIDLGGSRWQVNAAPGHDTHSVILFEAESGTLLSADALWERGFGVVFPELIGEPSFQEVADTLDLIERLAPSTVVPGHGPVFADVTGSLAVARKRLARLAADPVSHARHAMKVLIKFKLLEARAISGHELDQWIARTPYFGTVCDRFFTGATVAELTNELLAELVRSGDATRDGDTVVDS